MIRRLAALVAAWGFVLAGPALVGPATPVVLGHSQLVTSVPGAGEVVATSPTEIQLVFSEPIEPAYTKLDLIGPDGATIASGAGSPDPADPYTLIAPVEHLTDGVYTVDWRSVSAADGHSTSGFFTFGVGSVSPPPQGGGGAAVGGSIHAGHDATTAFLETESRIAGDLGVLLAFGLPIVAWLVLRDRSSAGVAKIVAACLGPAAFGAAGLLLLGASELGSDVVTYATGARTGQLLLARTVVMIVSASAAWLIADRRPQVALGLGGFAGFVGIVLLAVGGHAAGFDTPAPAVAIAAHLLAVGTWLSGLLMVAWVAIGGREARRSLPTIVPRFSALALVSVGLIALTGAFSDWVQTGSLISFETPYSTTLMIKIGLAVTAFAIGGLNYLSGGRSSDGRFRPRVAIEAGLALAVLVATGVLASGSPPSGELPVAIAPAASSVATTGPSPTLALAPGRPGPTRFVVTVKPGGSAAHESVELELQRLDQSGSTRVPLAAVAGQEGEWAAAGALLPAGSRWDASVVLRDHAGVEQSRTRYSFALDASGVSEGRATPAIDPAAVVAVILLLAAVLGLAFSLGGGALPRVDPATSRIAVMGGSTVGAIVGIAILVWGAPL